MASDLSPALLVAMPQLLDRNFRGAVVLVVHHDEEGTFGLVLNRPTDLPVEALCDGLEMPWHGDPDALVRWGGPVDPDRGWVLVGGEDDEDIELSPVAEGIQVTSSPEALRRLAADPPTRMRVFLGYAGWGPGQLAQELQQGTWLVAPVAARFVFDAPEEGVWEQVIRSLGIDPSRLVATPGLN
jgi:putative transcriptional regulator